jgi:hypothetical protein
VLKDQRLALKTGPVTAPADPQDKVTDLPRVVRVARQSHRRRLNRELRGLDHELESGVSVHVPCSQLDGTGRDGTPLGRLGVFLASDLDRHVTGQLFLARARSLRAAFQTRRR